MGLPWNLLCLASYLIKDYKIKIIDGSADNQIVNTSKNESKDSFLVGISVLTLTVEAAYRISKAIKEIKNIPIVWGGVHPTLLPEQTVKCKYADFVIHGEGEIPLLKLISALENNGNIQQIRGLVYKKNGKVFVNERESKIDLNNRPRIPDELISFEDYANLRLPLGKSIFSLRGIPLYTSRGCPYNCTFCANVLLSNQEYRKLSPENTLSMVEYFVKKYNLNYIRFRDDNFFRDADKVKAILKGLINRDIKIWWSGSCRADYFKRGHVDEELLPLMAKSNCKILYIGVEAGTNERLKKIKKGITVEMILKAAHMCNQYGIEPHLSFMIGFPGETKKELYSLVNLMKKIKRICPSSNFLGAPSILWPFPGGELTDEIIKKGWLHECHSVEDWFSPYIKDVFITHKKTPWIKHTSLIKSIVTYIDLAYERYDFYGMNILAKPFFLIFRIIALFRIRFNFYSLPIDRVIYNFLRKKYERRFSKKIIKKHL